jgi:putative hydrolase
MKLLADYHTHTIFSHGKGSVEDNVRAALEKGLTGVGIADHSVRHYAYGVRRSRLGEYIKCIEDAKKRYGGKIEIKTGIELNLLGLDGSIDLPSGYGFNMAILGFHKAVLYKNFGSAWAFFTGANFGHAEDITRAYMLAIQKSRIDIIAHPGYVVPVDYRLLGRACADYGTLFEINNKHQGLTAEDIEEAASEGARFVLSSDAHNPQDVGNVSKAIKLAESARLSTGRIVNAE